jgi:hypothetical protein
MVFKVDLTYFDQFFLLGGRIFMQRKKDVMSEHGGVVHGIYLMNPLYQIQRP